MKQILLSFAILLICFATEAQVKKDTAVKPVPHPPIEIPITDSTRILQRRDVLDLFQLLGEYPAKYANPITQWISDRFNQRLAEYKAHPKNY